MRKDPKLLNILYLPTHDLGRYVQPYGYAIPAPNVQKLAERGVLFRQAFSVAPTCSPSRSGLVTGRWAHCNGMFGLTNQGWTLNNYSQHIARFLSRNGWKKQMIPFWKIQFPSRLREGRTSMKPLTSVHVMALSLLWLIGLLPSTVALGGNMSESKMNFVRISPRDPRYFELSDGSPYIAIGSNLVGPPKEEELEAIVQKMA